MPNKEKTETAAGKYTPGVCNINTQEVRTRRRAGYVGVVIYCAILAIIVAADLPVWFGIALVFPGFVAAIGFLQAKNCFCVAYAAAGLQNAAEGSTQAHKITDTAAAAQDRARARRINLQAITVAFAATVIGILLGAVL